MTQPITINRKLDFQLNRGIKMDDDTKPEPTKADVKETAERLMGRNVKTTNLDVKDSLRLRDFWAKQSVVSGFMKELANEEGWKKERNAGGYYEYSIPSDDDDDEPDDDDDQWW